MPMKALSLDFVFDRIPSTNRLGMRWSITPNTTYYYMVWTKHKKDKDLVEFVVDKPNRLRKNKVLVPLPFPIVYTRPMGKKTGFWKHE